MNDAIAARSVPFGQTFVRMFVRIEAQRRRAYDPIGRFDPTETCDQKHDQKDDQVRAPNGRKHDWNARAANRTRAPDARNARSNRGQNSRVSSGHNHVSNDRSHAPSDHSRELNGRNRVRSGSNRVPNGRSRNRALPNDRNRGSSGRRLASSVRNLARSAHNPVWNVHNRARNERHPVQNAAPVEAVKTAVAAVGDEAAIKFLTEQSCTSL